MLYTYFVVSKQVFFSFELEECSMAINSIWNDYFGFELNSVSFPTEMDENKVIIDTVIKKLRGMEEHKVCDYVSEICPCFSIYREKSLNVSGDLLVNKHTECLNSPGQSRDSAPSPPSGWDFLQQTCGWGRRWPKPWTLCSHGRSFIELSLSHRQFKFYFWVLDNKITLTSP